MYLSCISEPNTGGFLARNGIDFRLCPHTMQSSLDPSFRVNIPFRIFESVLSFCYSVVQIKFWTY